MKDRRNIAYVMITLLLLMTSGLAACSNQKDENLIVSDMEIEGEADKVLSLENDCELWTRIGTVEDNYGQLRAYIIDNSSGEIIPLPLEELEATVCLEQEPLWQYQDVDDDGKSDIMISGAFMLSDGTETSGMWVYRQTQDGGYELWEDAGRINLMRKIA